jgi:hypothetical protein
MCPQMYEAFLWFDLLFKSAYPLFSNGCLVCLALRICIPKCDVNQIAENVTFGIAFLKRRKTEFSNHKQKGASI